MSADEHIEVLIIGGGPAGSSCAWVLQRAGMDVAVLDKADFPRDKVCAGWITPAVVAELELNLEAYGRQNTLQPLTSFRVGLMGGREVDTDYDRPVSFGIRRCEFDHYMLQRSGARLLTPKAVKKIERHADGGWLINGHIRAAMLVGAGGHFCPVARHLGAQPGSREAAVLAKEIEFPMTETQARQCPVKGERAELFFCPDLKGYGWVLRKGKYLNVGLGRQDPRRLSTHLDEFVQSLKQRGLIPHDTPDEFHGHAYLLYGDTPRTIVEDGVVLIGDAAGLAYAQSGEGIRPAIESGLMAGAVIAQTRGDFSAQRLQPYAERLIGRFGPRHRKQTVPLQAWIPAELRRNMAARLLSSPWFARHMVLDRWFFHSHQQPLQI